MASPPLLFLGRSAIELKVDFLEFRIKILLNLKICYRIESSEVIAKACTEADREDLL